MPEIARHPSPRRRSALLVAIRRSLSERGQSVVEFAIVVPFLLSMVFGVAEFGVVFSNQVNLANAVRDGVRSGAIHNDTSVDAVNRTVASGAGLISCALNTPTASYTGGSPDELTVAAQCNYTPITLLGSLVGVLMPATLQASATMRVEP